MHGLGRGERVAGRAERDRLGPPSGVAQVYYLIRVRSRIPEGLGRQMGSLLCLG